MLVQLQIMAVAMRDALMPLEWLPRAEFRLTKGVRWSRAHGKRRRANIHGFVHRFYLDPPDGNPHNPILQDDVWWDVTAVHRITGIFISEEWTSVQFCPQPVDYPNVKVWTNVRHWYTWWAELVHGGLQSSTCM